MNTMSGFAIDSAGRLTAAARHLRGSLGILCQRLARRLGQIKARSLGACAAMIVASVSAAYAVMQLQPAPPPSAAIGVEAAAAGSPVSVRPKCPACGVVESMRELTPIADDARAPQGAASPRLYEVTLRMADGSSHRFTDPNPANWRLGERVILIGAANPASD